MEETDPDLSFAGTFDLLDPALWWFGPRESAPKTSDIEIDLFALSAMAAVYVPLIR
jgi:hypothetical protein